MCSNSITLFLINIYIFLNEINKIKYIIIIKLLLNLKLLTNFKKYFI